MKFSQKSRVLIISHYYKRAPHGGGPPQEVRDFFLPKVKSVVYIEHPFPYADDHRSSMTIYTNGKLEKVLFTPPLYGPTALFYCIDIFLTLYFLLKAWQKYDLVVALDNLNTFSVAPLKWAGIIKKLVFYTIDYTPKRFSNPILNWLYHWTDRRACYWADAIWVLSERMTETRTTNGVDIHKSALAILLPMGAQLDRITPLPFSQIHRHQLIFVGHLLAKQGAQLVLRALPSVKKKIPHLRFVIVGQGEYAKELQRLTKELKINELVEFKGFVESHEVVEKLVCESAVGIAPYEPTEDNYTFYTDPGKPKLYLGCGLPVILTGVPLIAKEIEKRKAGIVVEYSPESIADALLRLFQNDALYKRYRQNALKLAQNYN